MSAWVFRYIHNIVGLVGVVGIVGAYFLSQIGRWSNMSVAYLSTNLVSSILIMVSLFFHWNLASFIIEVFWAGISLVGFCRRSKPLL